jgi:digeranylgeranylglycerophospholipid reductase
VAQTIASEGGAVLILEEHPEVGVPSHCTGKVSVNAVQELGLEVRGVVARVRGATLYPPSVSPVTIVREDVQALILDRRIFDLSLAAKAVNAGATLITDARVTGMSVKPDGVTVVFEKKKKTGEVHTRLVVGADGATSVTARLAGLYSKTPSEVRIGVQREVADVYAVQNMVDLYFGRRWAPGFFAWIVPTGHDTARVGLALRPTASAPVDQYLDDFVENHPMAREKLRGGRVVAESRHILPTGGVLRRVVADGVLVVGDAAGQVKSTTGGGLYYGMACAQMAGRAVGTALRGSPDAVLRADALWRYEKEWRARFGGEIAFSVRVRAFLDALSDDEVDYLFTVLHRDASLIRRIEVDGDIDRQSKVGMTLLRYAKYAMKKPGLLVKLRKAFPRLSRA